MKPLFQVAPLLLIGFIVAACISAPPKDWCALSGRPEPVTPSCKRNRFVESYLTALQNEIRPHFQLPPGHNDDSVVEIRMVIAMDGSLTDRCISRSSDSNLARSALRAVDAAAPFPPIPSYGRCLAGAEIVRHVYTVER